MSEHKYNDAYNKGYEKGKQEAFTGYCMQCYDELSKYEQAKLMVELGADISNILDKSDWIPVSERLPEKSTWVLVTCKNPDGYIYLDIKLINQHTGLLDGDEDFIGTVLAWMSLPKPYKEESEE